MVIDPLIHKMTCMWQYATEEPNIPAFLSFIEISNISPSDHLQLNTTPETIYVK